MALELRKQAELMENPVIGNLVGQAAFAAAIAISNEASETRFGRVTYNWRAADKIACGDTQRDRKSVV